MTLVPLDVYGQYIESIFNQFDLKISELRDALRGTGNRTLTDLYDELTLIDDLRGALDSVASDKLRVSDGGGSLTIDNTNIDNYLPNLDVSLSTRASESTLSAVDSKLGDLRGALSSVATDKVRIDDAGGSITIDNSNLDTYLPNLNTTLSSRASESTLSGFSGKFPSASALGDSLGNPTTTIVGSALLGWDGTYWRRLAADSSSRLRTVVESLPSIPSGSNIIGGVFAEFTSANSINQQVGTTEVTGSAVDVRRGGRKVVYMYNSQDVAVTVTIEGSYDGSDWYTIRDGITLGAGDKKIGILTDAHGYVRAKAVASSAPSTGSVLIRVSRMT